MNTKLRYGFIPSRSDNSTFLGWAITIGLILGVVGLVGVIVVAVTHSTSGSSGTTRALGQEQPEQERISHGMGRK